MKTLMLTLVTIVLSQSAFAAETLAVLKAAATMKANDTRTITKEVMNTDENPCMPEGKSFIVELQVKKASWNPLKSKVVYSWETAKIISVEKDGKVMEVCAE